MHCLLNLRTNKEISFPEDIHELTPEQYLFYLDIVLQNMVGDITSPDEIKQRLFKKFTNLKISWKLAFRRQETEEAIWSALTEKINLLDSFFDISEAEDGHPVYSLHTKCTANLLPEWRNFKGPNNLLMDITWGEFKQCLNALKLLQEAEKEGNITDMERYTKDIFFCLYKWPFNHSTPLKKIPDTVQFHALTYFSYWYELITTCPITINGEEIDFTILWKSDPDDPTNELDKSGWLGVTFTIAESGVFGDSEDVDNQKLYKVLMYIYKQKAQAIFDKEQLKKLKNDKPE